MERESEQIRKILGAHRHEELKPTDVEVVPDLVIVDLYAARVGGDAEYLVHLKHGFAKEVLFDGWPPARPEAGRATERSVANETTQEDRSMVIEDIMSNDVRYCRPEDSLESCARQLWEYDCGSLPVCVGNGEPRVIGMITDRDICMCALHEGKPLSELRVSEAMSREAVTCRRRDQSDAVEQLMQSRQIRRVPVTDEDGKLIGIVSLADLAREATGDVPARNRITESEVGSTLAAICVPNALRGGAQTGARA